MKGRIAFFLLAIACSAAGTLLDRAPARSLAEVNPLEGQEQAQRAGAKLYHRECAACHGAEGRGSRRAPPLARAGVYEASPGALFWVLRNGSSSRNMPSFAHLPEPQLWQIVSYLRHAQIVDRRLKPPAAR